MHKLTPELVAEHIKLIPTLSDEDLAYHFKCSSSSDTRLLKPYKLAIEKERKARNKRPLKDPEPTEAPDGPITDTGN